MANKKVHWFRKLFNGYEPDNEVRVDAEDKGDRYEITGIKGTMRANDGNSEISVEKQADGSYTWRNDNKIGTADSFDEAYRNLPALITDPDEYYDGDVIE
ncbi:MAG: hypothetical protein F6K45_23150 [Kamptonema sp. SIO1D9]|nr:hypothetical protein [Kamptonema sp. SIO1D9]